MPTAVEEQAQQVNNIGIPDTTYEHELKSDLLLFAFEYPPVSGGISRLCAEVARNLACRQVQVSVLTQGCTGSVEQATRPEVRVTSKRLLREWQAFVRLRHFKRHASDQHFTLCGVWYPEGLIAQLAGLGRIIILAHGAELLPPPSRLRRRLWSTLQRRVLESAHLVVANSEYTRKLVKRVAPEAKVEAIPLAVNSRQFVPGDRATARRRFGVADKKVLCTVARIHEYKGIDVVLRAIAKLPRDEREQLLYLIVGSGPHEQELKKLVTALAIDRQVRWMGFLPERDLAEVYRASDLFVLCTRDASERQAIEGFGMVFLEAQSSGIAVVGTNTGGIPDAIREGDGGWLIEQEDSNSLSEILRKLVRDPESIRAAGIRARQRVLNENTWERYSQRFLCALQSANIVRNSI